MGKQLSIEHGGVEIANISERVGSHDGNKFFNLIAPSGFLQQFQQIPHIQIVVIPAVDFLTVDTAGQQIIEFFGQCQPLLI